MLPSKSQNWQKVFGIPLLVGLASAAGLMSALLLGEAGRVLAWFAVGLPIGLVAWSAARGRVR